LSKFKHWPEANCGTAESRCRARLCQVGSRLWANRTSQLVVLHLPPQREGVVEQVAQTRRWARATARHTCPRKCQSSAGYDFNAAACHERKGVCSKDARPQGLLAIRCADLAFHLSLQRRVEGSGHPAVERTGCYCAIAEAQVRAKQPTVMWRGVVRLAIRQ